MHGAVFIPDRGDTAVTHFRQVGPDRWRMKQMAFIPHPGRSFKVVKDASRADRFAEHLAHGATVAVASELVGVSAAYGNAMLQRIRRRLGPQAI